MEACHKDGTRSNNSLTNLRWDTKSANSQDSIRHGTHMGLTQKGMAQPNSKLTDQQVLKIRALYTHGHLQKDIAKMFNVHQVTISEITLRKHWTHI
jgi:Spy/CpxP family protein refolding chaperone